MRRKNQNTIKQLFALANEKITPLQDAVDCDIATEEEKKFLIDALHADGKDWDADNKQIVDYKCKPKIGDTYYYIDCFLDIVDDIWSGDRMDDLVYTSGNCFKTKEEAQMYADKFIKILKERKL